MKKRLFVIFSIVCIFMCSVSSFAENQITFDADGYIIEDDEIPPEEFIEEEFDDDYFVTDIFSLDNHPLALTFVILFGYVIPIVLIFLCLLKFYKSKSRYKNFWIIYGLCGFATAILATVFLLLCRCK